MQRTQQKNKIKYNKNERERNFFRTDCKQTGNHLPTCSAANKKNIPNKTKLNKILTLLNVNKPIKLLHWNNKKSK